MLWHRLRANHLGRRLPSGSLAVAAFAGLQDSAPRAALTALHARVEAVEPSDWEHPALVQTWAPRGAVFVVPRADLEVFSLGISPRDDQVRDMFGRLAARAGASVGEPRVKGGRRRCSGRSLHSRSRTRARGTDSPGRLVGLET